MFRIKICGMRDSANITRVSYLNPDMMGLIFYRNSPRYAGDIADPVLIRNLPSAILKTGVFVNENKEKILETAGEFGLGLIQLHGDESPEFCSQIRNTGLKVVRVFRISDSEHFKDCAAYVDCTDFFLFDTMTAAYGGSGSKFDWRILGSYSLQHPFVISGGIGPDDADMLLSIKNQYLVGADLNSRFETEPGIKDINTLERFILKIRQNTNSI